MEAPTAPHATHPVGGGKPSTGPARFWDPSRIRTALTIALVFSLGVHIVFAPWRLFPSRVDVELKDADGELAIPVDLLGEEPPPPESKPPPEAPPPTEDPSKDPNGPNAMKPDAAAPPKRDAGPPKDAGVADAESPELDAGPSDAAAYDGGLLAMGDAGVTDAGGAGPTDPTAGVPTLNTGPQNIVLVVNSAVIRKHPVGARMGPVIQQIPQWRDFLKGSQSVVDPIQHTDWILIYGPSLIHTDRDAVLVRYNVSDAIVDQAVDAVARTYDKGGPYDAGVPGVPASRGHADNAERIFMRPQPKLLVIAPPAHAHAAAKTYSKAAPRGPSPKEAMHLVVRNPTNQIAIPNLKFKDSLKEIQLWIEPRSDGGADLHAVGQCSDEACAVDSSDALNDFIKRQNAAMVRIATRGLLNNAKVFPDGNKVRLDLVVSQDQLEAILNLVGAAVGANVPPPSPAPP
jgi:hypothetical protein